MTKTRTKRTLGALVVAAATLALAAPADAKGGGGGGGGGGTTSPVGAIRPVSAAVPCDGGTTMSLTVQKGKNKVVEEVLTMSGPTGGWWDYALREDSTGRGLVVSGGTMSDLGTSTAVITTSTGSTLAPGTWDLTFTATHRIAANSTVVESCLAHLTVTAV